MVMRARRVPLYTVTERVQCVKERGCYAPGQHSGLWPMLVQRIPFSTSAGIYLFFLKKKLQRFDCLFIDITTISKKKVQEKIKGVLPMRLEIKPTMKKNLIKRSIEPCHYLATNLRPHFHQKKNLRRHANNPPYICMIICFQMTRSMWEGGWLVMVHACLCVTLFLSVSFPFSKLASGINEAI
jgi:hypothetical protein